MKATSLASIRPLQNTQFWLLAIAGGLIAIHLSLSWRLSEDFSKLAISAFGWGAVLSLLSEKRRSLSYESDIFSSLVGVSLIAIVLVRSFFMTSFNSIFDFTPFVAALGLALLASGVKGLRQYWLELFIVFAVNAPIEWLLSGFDLSLLTAKFSAAILSYAGFENIRQGINITLPTGAVEVLPSCSGLESMVRLLRLSVLFLVMFPTNLTNKFLVPIVAVLIAFVVNGLRVALMALLVAYTDEETFYYWHLGGGSQIYFLISTVIFGGFCYFISQQNDSENSEPRELSES